MLKRTLALLLALLLCGAALSESAYDCVVRAGYQPATKDAQSATRVCYFEEKGEKATLLWTDGRTQYRLEETGDLEAMEALYVRLLSLEDWERCQFISGGKRLFGFNAPKKARNSYPTLERYIEAVSNRVYGTTPAPQATATPRPTDTPRPTPRPTRKADAAQVGGGRDYVLNTNTMKFHRPECEHVREIYDKNRKDVHMSRQEILDLGYVPCKNCDP